MIAILDTSADLDMVEAEIGAPVEQLLTPLTRFNRRRKDAHFAIDNGAFSAFDADAFRKLLKRESDAQSLCRFVAVPDVVASALRTKEVFGLWRHKLSGWKIAYVVQDGQETVPIPWKEIDALFIGGTTEFKLGPVARSCIAAAKCAEKWVHVGRVNTPARWNYFNNLGADSIDGSGLARYSWMREEIFMEHSRPTLFDTREG